MEIGKAIKDIRARRGIKQRELAERMEMTPHAVSLLEAGATFPSRATINKLCKALGVPQSYLLLGSIDLDDIPEGKKCLYNAMVRPLFEELLK